MLARFTQCSASCCNALAAAGPSSARIVGTSRSYYSRREIPIPPPEVGTREDILALQAEIDAAVWERGDIRKATLPLQVQDNRLRALYKAEHWKLRCFDVYREIKSRPPLSPEELEERAKQRTAKRLWEREIKEKVKLARYRQSILNVGGREAKLEREAQRKREKDIRSVGVNHKPPVDPEKRKAWERFQIKKDSLMAMHEVNPDDPILVEGTKEERQAHRRKIREVLKLVTQQLAEQDKEEEEERQRLGLPPLKEEPPKKKRGLWG